MVSIYRSILLPAFLLLAALPTEIFAQTTEILSPEETAWIKANGSLNVANEHDWPPFDFVVDGKPAGYSIDLLSLIAQKTGMELNFVSSKPWRVNCLMPKHYLK